jgi:hypothetical protein
MGTHFQPTDTGPPPPKAIGALNTPVQRAHCLALYILSSLRFGFKLVAFKWVEYVHGVCSHQNLLLGTAPFPSQRALGVLNTPTRHIGRMHFLFLSSLGPKFKAASI